MFRILIFGLMSSALAGPQFSQGHIKYSNVDGAKVDWKLYAPYSQFKSQLGEYRRREEAKSQPEAPVEPTPVPAKSSEPLYKPFSQVPHHLKQLLTHSYEPQPPYVDPNVFFHPLPVKNAEELQEKISPEAQETFSKTQSTGAEIQDQRHREETPVDYRGGKETPQLTQAAPASFAFDRSVPLEIQQLLHYQAQIPYNVIANHIIYKPEKPFVPEPLPEDETGPYQYRSRVYYAVKVDQTSNKAQDKSSEDNRSYE